jgi:glycosyltransferase involved in cell wall biosynthesis
LAEVIRLSLIIATWNRGPSLVRTLESVAAQDVAPALWEVVVVDNNSTDNTRELFERFAAAHPALALRIVSEEKQGLSHARNRGIAESTGPIIAIIDDDEEVNTGFVRAWLDFFDNYDGAAAGGEIVPHYDTRPPRWLSPLAARPITGELSLGSRVREFPAGRFPGGGNMAVRRQALEHVGVFDPDLGRTGAKLLAGEEKDLFARLRKAGGRIYYVPGARILHIIPRERLTLGYLARVSRMSGVTERTRAGRVALLRELFKWAATLVLALLYTLTLRPAKAWGLLVLRWNVTRGIMING